MRIWLHSAVVLRSKHSLHTKWPTQRIFPCPTQAHALSWFDPTGQALSPHREYAVLESMLGEGCDAHRAFSEYPFK